MGLQKRLVAQAPARRDRESVARVLVDGPSSDHELVLKARLATQAPDIDAAVYLTDCDPSSLPGGDFVEVEIVGRATTTTWWSPALTALECAVTAAGNRPVL